MKIAAIYARVSSDQQKEENTIASQTAALVEFAREQGFSVPDEWVIEDEGFSGASLLRPGLERLRDLAAEGQIQAVLIHAPDRLSRKYAYQVLLTEEFARHGVEKSLTPFWISTLTTTTPIREDTYRKRKARDEHGKCGTQSADESIIDRRRSDRGAPVRLKINDGDLHSPVLFYASLPHDGHESGYYCRDSHGCPR